MRRKTMGKSVVLCAFLLAVCLTCTGCGKDTAVIWQLLSEGETYAKEGDSYSDAEVRDKDSLYTEKSGIITMYLTVGRGNAEEDTDHSWEELNAYPLSYYEEQGIEPYKCEALLQIGDEIGPLSGELGYGQTVANGTVRVRGENSSRQPQKSYRIDIKGGKGDWEGQQAIVLNKHSADPVRFTNRLAYSLMEDVPELFSARTGFVHLYVKDRTEGEDEPFVDYGLYTQVEQINRTYLRNRNLDADGYLYKAEELFDWRRHEDAIKTMAQEGYDLAAFEQYLEVKGNEEHSKLIELLEAVNDMTLPTEELVARYFDEDNLFYWMAFQILMGNGETARGSYYLYSPQTSNLWYFISWNNEESLTDTYTTFRGRGWGSWQEGMFPFTEDVLFRRVLQDAYCRERLAEAVEDLQAHYLTTPVLEEKIGAYAALVKPFVYELPDRMFARVDSLRYDQLAEDMAAEVAENYRLFQEQMQSPWPFAIHAPVMRPDGLLFTWEDAYSFDGRVTYTLEISRGFSFDTVLLELTGLTEASATVDALPAGQYFLRVTARDAAGRTQTARTFYNTELLGTAYGVACFYVQPDGTAAISVFDEGN